jgi:AraC-like DNA-binding protein
VTSYLRSASLNNYGELARSLGLDPTRMLARVGLPPGCLDSADLRLSADAVMALLELSAQESGEQAFGLRLAETRRLSTLGLVGMLARDEPTLREAIATLVRYGWQHNESLATRLEESNGIAVLTQELTAPSAGRQSIELAVGALHRILRLLLGAEWSARAVCFTHPAPAVLDVHRRLFGRGVRFSQEFNGIVLRSTDLDTPMAMADPVMRSYAQQMLIGATPTERGRARHEVQQLILALLPTGRCNADQVALHMGVDRRTVHRRLAREGCSFSELLQETRQELVLRHLSDGRRLLSEIAPLLGFSSLSAFSRWRRTH